MIAGPWKRIPHDGQLTVQPAKAATALAAGSTGVLVRKDESGVANPSRQ